MHHEYRRSFALLVAAAMLALVPSAAQVIATGAMKHTLWEGQRAGIIAMDPLAVRGMYGMGPLEHMRGEITLVDGRCHVAHIVNDSIVVVQDSTVRAPFFVHGRVSRWEELELPGYVEDHGLLEAFLGRIADNDPDPFFFRLNGRFADVGLHVWDLPAGSAFTGPQEGARYKRHFIFRETDGLVLGVFSRHHRTVFTHHDSFVHLHFVSGDGRVMGHVDKLLFIPEQVRLEIGRP